MDELEWLCEDLSSDATNQDFRLWLTTETTKAFSVPTLQLGQWFLAFREILPKSRFLVTNNLKNQNFFPKKS